MVCSDMCDIIVTDSACRYCTMRYSSDCTLGVCTLCSFTQFDNSVFQNLAARPLKQRREGKVRAGPPCCNLAACTLGRALSSAHAATAELE